MPNKNSRPYLTMVTYTRNDDYAGGIVERLQFTLDILFEQIDYYKIESELIIVEWNPPKDKLRLESVLSFPKKTDYLSIRIIEVPEEIHRRYMHSDLHPLHGAVAFNTALIRARGEFTVVRVSDSIWSDELLKKITKKNLSSNSKYRCVRADVNPDVLNLKGARASEVLNFCHDHITMIMTKMRYYVKGLPPLLLNSDGDFQLISTDRYQSLRGWYETKDVGSANVDGLLEHCAFVAGLKDEVWEDVYNFKIDNKSSYKNRVIKSIFPFMDNIFKSLPITHITPLLIKISRITGLTKIIYDNRVTTIRGIKMPTKNEYYEQCKKIVNGEESYVLNGDVWGLCNEDLNETQITKAAWE
jgi:hypothetical protein